MYKMKDIIILRTKSYMMASYLKITPLDWLDIFRRNWANSKHLKICNQDDEEILWLLAHPDFNPFNIDRLDDLSILLYRPRQEIPRNHFKISIINNHLLQINGRVDDANVKLLFKSSSNNQNILHASLNNETIWFDISDPRQDYFFQPFDYNNIQRGDKVLYSGKIWRFISWVDINRRVHIERLNEDDSILTKEPLIQKCLLVHKPLPRGAAFH